MGFILLVAGFILELIYFRIADKFNIIDKPNERSSHTKITIRGGGIVYVFAGLFCAFSFGMALPYFWAGFLLISILSFIDDIVTLSSRVRMPFQFLAVALMLFQVFSAHPEPILLWVVGLIVATGIINAYNFMDGINGITVGYSAVTLGSFWFLNEQFHFIDERLIVTFFIANLVFAFFNFRTKAKAFAGDVGSVSIAFMVVYLLFNLILATQNLFYILLLAVYGVDSVLTIIYRLRKGENIFEAHRSHLYQWLVKPGPFSHVQMASIYLAVQAVIAAGVFALRDASAVLQWTYAAAVLGGLGMAYIFIKKAIGRKYDWV